MSSVPLTLAAVFGTIEGWKRVPVRSGVVDWGCPMVMLKSEWNGAATTLRAMRTPQGVALADYIDAKTRWHRNTSRVGVWISPREEALLHFAALREVT